MTPAPRRQPLGYQHRLIATAIGAVAPVTLCAFALLLAGDYPARVFWTTIFFVAIAAFIATYTMHEVAVHPLRTLSNLVAALREEDYSLRGRATRSDDALGEIFAEVNALAEVLEARKIEALEATALLRAVLAEIDAAIFAFDGTSRLQLVNRAGERLLGEAAERLRGRTAAELGIEELVADDGPDIVERAFAGTAGRWSVRRSTFREKGLPHRLLVVADITRALREEELQAWQRIVRVLSHELNNSLAPMKSIAASVERVVTSPDLAHDWRDDVVSGMRVIGNRVEALGRFTRAYAQLARVPRPALREVSLAELGRRVAALETRLPVAVDPNGDLLVDADPDQLEQLLINLVRNAVDASLETGGGVALRWRGEPSAVVITVADEGLGLSGTANLFVPFFTTKPTGSGIGLVLSRQIAEAHGGSLTLANREDRSGAIATLRLPRQ
jgi:PAS domain S-box-containing protein